MSVVLYKISKIGIQLGIPYNKLKEFEKEDDPLAAVIDYWLRGNVEGVPVNWKSIVDVLKSSHVDENGLAKRIALKYCSDRGGEIDDGEIINNHQYNKSSSVGV